LRFSTRSFRAYLDVLLIFLTINSFFWLLAPMNGCLRLGKYPYLKLDKIWSWVFHMIILVCMYIFIYIPQGNLKIIKGYTRQLLSDNWLIKMWNNLPIKVESWPKRLQLIYKSFFFMFFARLTLDTCCTVRSGRADGIF